MPSTHLIRPCISLLLTSDCLAGKKNDVVERVEKQSGCPAEGRFGKGVRHAEITRCSSQEMLNQSSNEVKTIEAKDERPKVKECLV